MPRTVGLKAAIVLTSIVSGFAAAVGPVSPALAACDGAPKVKTVYTFKNKVKTTLPSNLKSDWIEGPATIHYHRTKSATVSAETTATVESEANIVFAKASASFGLTVGYSYSWTDEWEYEKKVPKGKDGRLRMYHDALGFTVTKKVWNGGACKFRHAYTANVKAPRKTGANYWRLQTRKS